jgi:hypothetical protein
VSSEIAIFFAIAALPSSPHSAKNQITRRRQIGAEHLAPELPNSTAVAWVWNPVRPRFQAGNRDQTLGLPGDLPPELRRSLNQQLRLFESRPEPPNHAEVRSYVSLANSEYRVSCFGANSVNLLQQLHRSSAAKSD